MKTQLLVLGCLVAWATGLPLERSCSELKAGLRRRLQAQDEGSESRLDGLAVTMRSCDADGDGALSSVEFGACMSRLTGAARRSHALDTKRTACFKSLMREADVDMDSSVGVAELRRWAADISSTQLKSRNVISKNKISTNNIAKNDFSRSLISRNSGESRRVQFTCGGYCLSNTWCNSGVMCLGLRCCVLSNNDDDDNGNGDNGNDGNGNGDGDGSNCSGGSVSKGPGNSTDNSDGATESTSWMPDSSDGATESTTWMPDSSDGTTENIKTTDGTTSILPVIG